MALFAHGAGTDQQHPMMQSVAHALGDSALFTYTFDYPFMAEGRRRPDTAKTLIACHRAVAEHVESVHGSTPVLVGRSMGARMATMLAAGDEEFPGIVCLAYPLHPAGKADRLRVEHLSSIAVPMLFVQGTRDALSRPDLFDIHIRALPNVTVVDLEGADHSFRGKDWSLERVARMVGEAVAAWWPLSVGMDRGTPR